MTGRDRLSDAQRRTLPDIAPWLPGADGTCAICGRNGRELVVDHDHATGEIRGWLCRPCNSAIGQLGDTASSVMRAVLYLAEPPVSLKRQFRLERRHTEPWLGRVLARLRKSECPS